MSNVATTVTPDAWDAHRRAQLGKFHALLQEASQLDKASGVFNRLERIVALANELSQADLDNDVDSFAQFLVRCANPTPR